ncbi:uncharacterized protein LOC113385695 [Ctenocephalides felis]|uniref:uncharacterized protein LOC113385695 n=1 Tax=Ctenocephalides felis TaxID=7515 RepID=UPI000E6E50EA|nr:uncharacterized protein LOC113385695 [Ctenocephalides felis]
MHGILLSLAVLLVGVCLSEGFSARQETDCQRRNSPGLICSEDCKSVSLCLKDGYRWLNVDVDTCTGGQFCNLREGGCSSKPGACNSAGTMQCDNEGIFPDPYDCQRYYFCTGKGAGGILKECVGKNAFDVVTGTCTSSLDSEICKNLAVDCQRAGENGPWPGDDHFYYICKTKVDDGVKSLYPQVYKCSDGGRYKKDSGCQR